MDPLAGCGAQQDTGDKKWIQQKRMSRAAQMLVIRDHLPEFFVDGSMVFQDDDGTLFTLLCHGRRAWWRITHMRVRRKPHYSRSMNRQGVWSSAIQMYEERVDLRWTFRGVGEQKRALLLYHFKAAGRAYTFIKLESHPSWSFGHMWSAVKRYVFNTKQCQVGARREDSAAVREPRKPPSQKHTDHAAYNANVRTGREVFLDANTTARICASIEANLP